ncbi:MAG TPA: ABC transporter ATP-binding protein [Candidatus Peribacterales bacterium]|nr:ABC transporter ATP-binding protein [Candidatus Peribacterales bacterium]
MQPSASSLAFAPATNREILRFVWHYVRKSRLTLAVMLVLLVLSTGLDVIKPFFYKEIVDGIANGATATPSSFQYLTWMVVLAIGCGAVHLTLHELASRLLGTIVTRTMKEAHSDVFAHTQRLSTQFHVNAFAGSTSRKIGRGTDALESMINRVWFNFLPLLLLTIGFVIVFAFFSPPLGIAMVGGMILFTGVAVVLNLRYAKRQTWTDEQDTKVTASMVDAFTGNATVKSFGKEHFEDERHGGVLREWMRRFWLLWRMGNFHVWILFMLISVIELAIMLLAVWMWYIGRFTPGDFILVSAYIGRLWGYMFDIGDNVRQYLQASAHVQEMVGLYHTPLAVSDPSKAIILRVPRGAITFRDVIFSYERTAAPVFKNFSMDIEAGEKIALVGHSGGGKSTFVKLLQRLYDVQSGRITIDGQDIAEITQQSLRQAIGLVPQDPILFHRSLAENIAYGKPHASIESIMDVARKAHAHEFIEKFPKGYDTLVGERGIKLSGGERQRVAIARAILADTPILILDEATSSLDSLSEKYIQEALEFLMRGRTTIVIAHRLSTIKKVDRILVIEHGEIVEEGTHSALIRKEGGVYRGFYELQAGGFIGE